MKRRTFLGGLGAGLAALAIGPRLARTATRRAPLRLLVVHKPIGTQPAFYDCERGASPRDFTLSPILSAFADLREHLVILDGLTVPKQPNTPGEDHGNSIVTFMTGGIPFRGDATTVPLAERISIDQILANHPDIGARAPVRSMQLAADTRCIDLFTRIQSYAGRGAPMAPEHRPFAAYERLFGAIADTPLTPEELARARRRRQSVLDFAREGLARMTPRFAADERERLERHLQAIRELETSLDRATDQIELAALERGVRDLEALDPSAHDAHHGELGRAHLDIVRTAFQCDLTRVVTFGWATGQSYVNFSKILPGVEDIDVHNLSHFGSQLVSDETAIHTWYCEQLAAYLRTLRETPDIDGHSLLDNTLVVAWSEMRLGVHTFDRVPIQLFGGAGGQLEGGRLLDFGGRPTNDLWLSITRAFGLSLDHVGDAERCTGELEGLFSPLSPASGGGGSRPATR